jgi:undecaprenyl-diphosphatase
VPRAHARRAAVVAVAAFVPFVVLAVLVGTRWGPLLRLDRRIDLHLNHWASGPDGHAVAWRYLSDVGSPAVLRCVLLVAGVALVVYRRVAAAVLCLGASLGSLALVTAVKDLIDRPRPAVPHHLAAAPGASFPSGHALTAAVTAFTAVVLTEGLAAVWRAVARVVALVLAAAVSFSRLVLGVHYPSDVVAGWFGAGALVALLVWVLSRRAARSAARTTQPIERTFAVRVRPGRGE